MDSTARKIAKKLTQIQQDIRKDLIDEIESQSEDLTTVFDPYSYSPVSQEIRDKYLNKLQMLQAVIQELAHLKQGNKQPKVKVLSLQSENHEKLVKKVNSQLSRLKGVRIKDIEFLQNQEDGWVAIITYALSPFSESQSNKGSFL